MSLRSFVRLALSGGVLMLAVACNQTGSKPASAASPAGEIPKMAAAASPVQEAVMTYLRDVRQIDLSKMDVAVKNEKTEGDKASCEAAFNLKDGSMPAMEYVYELTRTSGAWKVTASRSKGAPHAGMPSSGEGAMPPGHPSPDAGAKPGALPAHGEAPAMPSGHPPVSMPPPAK